MLLNDNPEPDPSQPDPSRRPRWRRPLRVEKEVGASRREKRNYISFVPMVTFEFNQPDGKATALMHDPDVPMEVVDKIDHLIATMPFDPSLHHAGYRMILRFERAVNLPQE